MNRIRCTDIHDIATCRPPWNQQGNCMQSRSKAFALPHPTDSVGNRYRTWHWKSQAWTCEQMKLLPSAGSDQKDSIADALPPPKHLLLRNRTASPKHLCPATKERSLVLTSTFHHGMFSLNLEAKQNHLRTPRSLPTAHLWTRRHLRYHQSIECVCLALTARRLQDPSKTTGGLQQQWH